MLHVFRARASARARLAFTVRRASTFLADYHKHVEDRAAMGIVPKPLDAARMSDLVKLMEDPPVGEEAELLDLLTNRVPPGVDEAAYVKASFLTAIAKGTAKSPIMSPVRATELLGTMHGGYNIATLVELLDNPELADTAGLGLKKTILMFDAFYDVEEKAKAGNAVAKTVMQSWADADWFTSRPEVPEKLTVTVFLVSGETNTDDLSPAPDAWSRPDIPLHALAMLKNPREVQLERKTRHPTPARPVSVVRACRCRGRGHGCAGPAAAWGGGGPQRGHTPLSATGHPRRPSAVGRNAG
jgi:aconitase B